MKSVDRADDTDLSTLGQDRGGRHSKTSLLIISLGASGTSCAGGISQCKDALEGCGIYEANFFAGMIILC